MKTLCSLAAESSPPPPSVNTGGIQYTVTSTQTCLCECSCTHEDPWCLEYLLVCYTNDSPCTDSGDKLRDCVFLCDEVFKKEILPEIWSLDFDMWVVEVEVSFTGWLVGMHVVLEIDCAIFDDCTCECNCVLCYRGHAGQCESRGCSTHRWTIHSLHFRI